MKLLTFLIILIFGLFTEIGVDAQEADPNVPFRQSVERPLNFAVIAPFEGFTDSLRRVDQDAVLSVSGKNTGYASDVIFYLLPKWPDVKLVPKIEGMETILDSVANLEGDKTSVIHVVTMADDRGPRDVFLMFFNLAHFQKTPIDCLADKALMKLRNALLDPLTKSDFCK